MNEFAFDIQRLIDFGFIETIKEKIPSEYEVNAVNHFGNSLLYVASASGRKEIVKYFLSLGADIEQANSHGFTPLCVSIYNGNLEIAKLLLKSGANINATSSKNESIADILESERTIVVKYTSEIKREFIEYLLKFENQMKKELSEKLKKIRLELLF
jgi:ankyrin repeat protein